MKILEYDKVDPLQVLHLTMLTLDVPFTPERAVHIRRTDPRPFPFFTVNAVEEDMVLGQVGVFRLPMVSTEGREDVGGLWAMSTHPSHAGRGIASCLLEEAHTRMRLAGLRFSTLGTDRYRTAYRLYRKHGYMDMNVWATALARWETAHQPTRLRAQPAGMDGFDLIEDLFDRLAAGYLGFAWRYRPFARLRDRICLEEVWVLWQNNIPLGYVFARKDGLVLRIQLQLLRGDVDAAEAVAAVTSTLKASYVQVTMSRPCEVASLSDAGYHILDSDGSAFMVKPLVPNLSAEEARRIFGIRTDRFLISWLDIT